MYNSFVKELLSKIKVADGYIYPNQQKYEIKDDFYILELYISDYVVSYRVFGDAYVMAMIKFLQCELEKNRDLKNLTLEKLIKDFDLPEFNYRNALNILDIIEQINEK